MEQGMGWHILLKNIWVKQVLSCWMLSDLSGHMLLR